MLQKEKQGKKWNSKASRERRMKTVWLGGGGIEGHEKIAGSRLTVTEKRQRDRMDGALAYSGIREHSQ